MIPRYDGLLTDEILARDGIPRASRPFESPMTLAVRNSRAPVAANPSLVAAGADVAEADPPEAVAAYPSVIDAERHPLYGHGVERHELLTEDEAHTGAPAFCESSSVSSKHVRQSRLSRWQEQR